MKTFLRNGFVFNLKAKVGFQKTEPFFLGCLQPIPGDPKDNGVAAMLDDRTICLVIQHGRHAIVFLHLQGLLANHLYILNGYYLNS